MAAPPHKFFGRVLKNFVNASWATWKRASVAAGVLSFGGGASRPYGRGMVRSYVGRSGGLGKCMLDPIHFRQNFGVLKVLKKYKKN